MLRARFLIAVMLCGLTAPRPCLAQIQLPSVNLGLTNFEDGFAVPGWFFQEFDSFGPLDLPVQAHTAQATLPR